MQKINPLLFYMNTSDYPQILKALKKLPVDQFHVNYMPYPFPHDLARDFFLEHTEYTHLITHPQDQLPPTPEEYNTLIQTVKNTGYDVISCVCNVEREGHINFGKWNICKILPARDKHKRYYNWIPQTKRKLGLLEVEFQGMPFTVISRKVIERRNLEGEYYYKGCTFTDGRFAMAPDLNFCHNCKKAGIKIFALTDIRLLHYANHKPTNVNKLPGSIKFIKYEKKK